MLTTPRNRLAPSSIPPDQLEQVARLVSRPGHLLLSDGAGHQVEMPEALLRHFTRMVRWIAKHKTVVIIPEDETLTTQAAADYLGVSRQHLVDMLDRGEVSHHRVGTHRRVKFEDLLAYEEARDRFRHQALDQLADQVDEAGLYFSDYTGEEG